MRLFRFLALLALATPSLAVTFSVTNVNDSGAGSLRDAILAANGNVTIDDVAFAIPGSGVHTIVLASPLPPITQPLTIDGYSQPGSSANTHPTGQGLDTALMIEIDGSGAGSGACLTVSAGNDDVLAMIIQGLVINRCPGTAILVDAGGDGTLIVGNFIGTDPTGQTRPGSQLLGIDVSGATGVFVGGSTAFERNLISGVSRGIQLSQALGTSVQGNLIGTNAAGDAAIEVPGNHYGIYSDASSVTIGGPTAASQNLISGTSGRIWAVQSDITVQRNRIGTDVTGTKAIGGGTSLTLSQATSALIQQNVITGETGILAGMGSVLTVRGNFIGTDETATLDLGNRQGLIILDSAAEIGGIAAGEGNVIAHNGDRSAGIIPGGGILVSGTAGVRIRGNRLFDNEALGIDLDGDGVTPNDPFDGDLGPNKLQNYPLITSLVPGASTTHVEGVLNSTPSTEFDIDLYATSACERRPQAYVQGETYLGTLPVTTDNAGNASFAIDLSMTLDAGQSVTATATDPSGYTSEFSQRILFSIDPPAGPSAGGLAATLSGTLFEPGAMVTVGGVAASNVNVVDADTITFTVPARPAGTGSDVTVLDPSGLRGTLRNGWLADFTDVPGGHPFHDFVVKVATNAITAGVGGGNFGVAASTLRQQMAVFLLKGKHGVCYVPPPCAGVFTDVPCPSAFADWIEALAAEGITGGCGSGVFCPGNPVTRQQMAVFLLKAKHEPGYAPPACSGAFADVPCPSAFAGWIEQLAAENITGGCGGGNYCPSNPNTRGQMAVFIVKTFSLE